MNRTLLPGPRTGAVRIPASKSQAHRMLICAALSRTPGHLMLDGFSEDIEATMQCLRALGAKIEAEADGLWIEPPAVYPAQAALDAGESGSTLRFLLPVLGALGVRAQIRMHGRLPERPLSPLWELLEAHGMQLRREDEFRSAREQAMDCLTAAEQTGGMLRQKLLRRYGEEAAEAAVLRMEELGLINDREYSRRFAADAVNLRSWPRRRIAAELQKRGVAEDVIAEALADVTEEEIWRAVNRAEPGLIRTEADELTYALHIMVRYEIEKALIQGTLAVADLPAAWNAKYKEYLGVDVPDNAHGCLQDIHWSMGDIGYFPSYALGSAYGAQAIADLRKTMDLDAQWAAGDMEPLKTALKERVWQWGSMKEPQWLVQSLCGGAFDAAHYTNYLKNKYTELYGL